MQCIKMHNPAPNGPAQPVPPSPELHNPDDERDLRRGPLPAGHPDTWGLLTAGTVLEGAPYEYRPPAP
jgi:hypothetical protein